MAAASGAFTEVAVQRDRRIVLAGTRGHSGGETVVVRLHPDGRLDAGFGRGMAASPNPDSTYLPDVLIDPDGKVLAGSYGVTMGIERYDASGRADAVFGPGGFTAVDLRQGPGEGPGGVQRIIRLDDGRLLVAGYTYFPRERQYAFVLAVVGG